MKSLKRLVSILWWGSLGLLIALAMLFSLAQVLLPQMEGVRQRIEALAGEKLGQSLHFATLETRLIDFTPTLVIDQVVLVDERGEPIIEIAELGVGLAFWRSLREGRPVIDHIFLSGTELTLERDAQGRVGVRGLQARPAEAERASPLALVLGLEWLRVRDSTVHWHESATDTSLRFSAINLEMENRGVRHRLRGQAELPPRLGGVVQVAAELRGGPTEPPADWKGEFYLKANGLVLKRLLGDRRVAGVALNSGLLDTQLWGRWQEGRIVDLLGRVNGKGLLLAGAEERLHAIEQLAGRFRWRGDGEGWHLQASDLLLGQEPEEPIRLSLSRQREQWRLQASRLPLESLAPLPLLLDKLPPQWREAIGSLSPRGALGPLHLVVDGQEARGQAELHRLGWRPWRKLPGVQGLSGQLRFTSENAELQLASSDGQAEFPRLFRDPLAFNSLNGEVFFSRDEGGWRLSSRRLAVQNDDIGAKLALDAWKRGDEPPYLDLRGRIHDGQAVAAPRYYPVGIMKPKLVVWLDRAFRAGVVSKGGVLYHGQLKRGEFPFRKQQGRFEVRFDAEDVLLDYREEWPRIAKMDAEVVFAGPGMSIDVRDGRLFDSPIDGGTVAIRDFKQPLLKVQARAKPSGGNVIRMLRESPLQKVVGEAVTRMELSGETGLRLGLDIPLNARMAEHSPLSVDGTLTLRGGELGVSKGVRMQQLEGALSFTERSLQADKLTARMYGAPTELSIHTLEDEIPTIQIVALGRAQAEALSSELEVPFIDRLKGEAPWRGVLDIRRADIGGSVLHIQSSLDGAAVDLPGVLNKTPEVVRELALDIHLSGPQAGLVDLQYGDRLHALFETQEAPGLRRAVLHFGEGKGVLPEGRRIKISGRIEQVVPEEWMGALKGRTREVERLPLQVRMSRLQLMRFESDSDSDSDSAVAEQEKQASRLELPPMDVEIADLVYGDIALGRLQFIVGKAEEHYQQLEQMELRHDDYLLQAKGVWENTPQPNSRLDINLQAGNVGRVSQRFGFASAVEGGKLTAEGQFSWPGSPMDFALATLQGAMKLRIEEGTLKRTQPGAGRILGLLSLHALPRRLFLDFRDVLREDIRFEYIAGTFRVADGNLYTQDLRLESLSARVLFSGRTGLVAHDYDQLVTVVPRVSESLPVAAGLAWGLQAGVVALLFQRLFGEEVDTSTMVRYRVDGPWESPEITRLDSPAAPSEAVGE